MRYAAALPLLTLSCGMQGAMAVREAAAPGVGPASLAGERKLVRNAWLELEVDDEEAIPQVIAKARAVAAELGGYVADERATGISIKVPNPRLEEAMGAVGGLGDVARREVRAQDVTAEHLDLGIRVDNARRLKARLTELVAAAQNVGDVLAVEKELARVTEELERLEGQQRLLENQVSFATLDLEVREEVSPGPVAWVFYGVYLGVKWLLVWD